MAKRLCRRRLLNPATQLVIMALRQKSGSVVCRRCGLLVGVNDERCFHCGCRNPGLWGYAPIFRRLGQDLGFVPLVTGGCILLYLACLMADPGGIRMGNLFSLFSPSLRSLFLFGASGSVPVFSFGRWWTLLSAGWLHGGLLHILFNLLWVRQLAPATAELYGAGRMVIIYTVSSISGFLASSLAGFLLGPIPILGGASFTIGASAAIFGLLGSLVYSGRRGSSAVGRQALNYALVLFVFGFMMAGIDNWAHAGGFLGGYLTGKWMDPMRPERINHLIAALICVLLSGASIILSVLKGY
ncbi:MAG: rhomboid family intramembrane serine protease [Acidobacteria bacterium]|nr:rhomboid family intramembrane serine protease [Acidobacteriota bacterium]